MSTGRGRPVTPAESDWSLANTQISSGAPWLAPAPSAASVCSAAGSGNSPRRLLERWHRIGRHQHTDGSSFTRDTLDEPAFLESEDHGVDGRRSHPKELLHVSLGRWLPMNESVRPYEGEVLPLKRCESWRSLVAHSSRRRSPHDAMPNAGQALPRACELSRPCPSSWSPQNTKISSEAPWLAPASSAASCCSTPSGRMAASQALPAIGGD